MIFKEMALLGEESWLKSQYYDWLERKRDIDFKREEARWISYIVMRNGDRDRSKSWSASSLGGCERRQEFVYLNMKPQGHSVQTRNIFANGDYMHMRHQVAGLMQGYLTDVEVPIEVDKYRLRGTLDGLCSDGSVVDFKSMNSRGFNNLEEPYPSHINQLHGYMFAQGASHGRMVYECKDTQRIKEFAVKFETATWEALAESLDRMNQDMDNKTLAAPLDPGSFDCRFCQFTRKCRTTNFEDLV